MRPFIAMCILVSTGFLSRAHAQSPGFSIGFETAFPSAPMGEDRHVHNQDEFNAMITALKNLNTAASGKAIRYILHPNQYVSPPVPSTTSGFRVTGTAQLPVVITTSQLTGGASGQVTISGSGWWFDSCKYVGVSGLRFQNTLRPTATSGSPDVAIRNCLYFWNCSNTRVHRCLLNPIEYSPQPIPDYEATWVLYESDPSDSASNPLLSSYNHVDRNRFEYKRTDGQFLGFKGNTNCASKYDKANGNYFFNYQPRLGGNRQAITLGASKVNDGFTQIYGNVFYKIDGAMLLVPDFEIISVKSSTNTIESNYFINCPGFVFLRVGNNSKIVSNRFVKTNDPTLPAGYRYGGVAITGHNHLVQYNWFHSLHDSVIVPDDSAPDSPDTWTRVYNAKIENNHFVTCEYAIRYGASWQSPTFTSLGVPSPDLSYPLLISENQNVHYGPGSFPIWYFSGLHSSFYTYYTHNGNSVNPTPPSYNVWTDANPIISAAGAP